MTLTKAPMPLFTPDDAQRAYDEWGCNCGPGAIAAIIGLTLDELRPYLCDFEAKGYTNPTLMWSILTGLGVRFSYRGGHLGRGAWPKFGLARVQWEGPWTRPGIPPRAAYRHTHWVGSFWSEERQEFGIFDINAIGNGSGWSSAGDWSEILVPWLLSECEPKASGEWYLTHAVEIDPAGRRALEQGRG